ncbi:MAG: cytochrome c peroxidase [Bacteroidota bacterium]
MKNRIVFALLFSILIFSCKKATKEVDVVQKQAVTRDSSGIDWTLAQNYYLENMTESLEYLKELDSLPMTGDTTKETFKMVRMAFKRAEPYGSYLNPEVGHRANGPALPTVTDDTQKLLPPVGLQKIEESIYDGHETEENYRYEVSITQGMLRNLQHNIQKRELTPQRFFIATHQQLMRIVSLGISGFDTPVSQLGLGETIVSLEGLADVYKLTLQTIIQEKDKDLDSTFLKSVSLAKAFVEKNPDFETFDRFTFLRDYMNPITRYWVQIRKTTNIWEPVDNKPFNFDAETFFDEDAFNPDFFAPITNRKPTKKRIELGRKLFFDKNLSQNGEMACATCHNPKKAWGDGLVLNMGNDDKELDRNTPTLINSAYQQAFFWDGRAPSIVAQITAVFNNDREFNSSVHKFSTEILSDTTYIKLFEEAYGGVSKRNTEIIKAISSYISTLNGFNSKFDRNIRAEENTFTEEEKLGFNLYMGKALCATCHFIPLTNGTVPPFFTEHEKEVIGVPETAANTKLDDDLGFYWRHNEELEVHRGMFKTPTVRNSEITAPYMHNGVYNTLEEVMNFYNLGGGGGMGFDLPYQTLPFDNLQLTKKEEKALVAFMKTLTDTEVGDEVY